MAHSHHDKRDTKWFNIRCALIIHIRTMQPTHARTRSSHAHICNTHYNTLQHKYSMYVQHMCNTRATHTRTSQLHRLKHMHNAYIQHITHNTHANTRATFTFTHTPVPIHAHTPTHIKLMLTYHNRGGCMDTNEVGTANKAYLAVREALGIGCANPWVMFTFVYPFLPTSDSIFVDIPPATGYYGTSVSGELGIKYPM